MIFCVGSQWSFLKDWVDVGEQKVSLALDALSVVDGSGGRAVQDAVDGDEDEYVSG